MKVERLRPLSANIGILGVGHHTYWGQFEGLLDELKGKMSRFETKVQARGVKVSLFGITDNAASAQRVLPAIKAADLDLLFIDMLTYATSSTFAVIARELSVPIVLVALQPLSAMDYPRRPPSCSSATTTSARFRSSRESQRDSAGRSPTW